MTRYGKVIRARADKIDEYKRLHAAPWPDVLAMIKKCNIHNYSIYLRQLADDQYYLFSYFEYSGDDFAADMAKMAADPTTQEWWSFTGPCLIPLDSRVKGEVDMEEVFHLD
jgi:L-rhamnose mutarotase